ncbi:hypothetical protein [Sphingomonas lacusdianchii]|uniref:hypothetical protein n=1 Tax=Sphingomonas lacusdianchii TaxID=2917992 RepID=UPI001F572E28|nr:hypothetical protein [Sphingomonas sp. JXJ CY 53]
MGLSDRDYMRERYRQRQGLGAGKTQWNDKKARREELREGHEKAVPLGSASWVGKGGPWFEAKDRGHDYQKQRYRPHPIVRPHPAQKWILLLSAITILIPAYREAKRSGWIPDSGPALAFPSSGSVTVNSAIDPRTATSRMPVVTDTANAVVQLFDRETDEHIISAYVRRQDSVTIPVPPGTYRMRVIEGDKWHGPVRFFGPSTTYETVVRPMVFTRQKGSGIDLHRSPTGTLHTRINITDPKPLN